MRRGKLAPKQMVNASSSVRRNDRLEMLSSSFHHRQSNVGKQANSSRLTASYAPGTSNSNVCTLSSSLITLVAISRFSFTLGYTPFSPDPLLLSLFPRVGDTEVLCLRSLPWQRSLANEQKLGKRVIGYSRKRTRTRFSWMYIICAWAWPRWSQGK